MNDIDWNDNLELDWEINEQFTDMIEEEIEN